MKKTILPLLILLSLGSLYAQCNANFSFTINNETVTFTNLSAVSNAHYFWNFGDGTGSNLEHPMHTFPENGEYMVTLFAKDTVSACSTYHDDRMVVTKYSTDTCQPWITDSIFDYNGSDYILVKDSSTDCNAYSRDYDAGPASNFPINNWIMINDWWRHFRFPSRLQCTTFDTINGFVLHREAYKTSLYNYTSANNYGDCSANFEFTVISQDTAGQTVFFRAMNSTATTYRWTVAGFGNPIYSYQDTMRFYYPYTYNNLHTVGLEVTGSSGCRDTLHQNILVSESPQTITAIDHPAELLLSRAYPNPFRDQITLEFPELKTQAVLEIFNSQGMHVRSLPVNRGGKVIVHREDLAAGMYYFRLQSAGKVMATGKMLAE
jgi:PKD repeat protein